MSKQASVEANVFAALFWILSATMKQNLVLYSEAALSCLKTFLTSVTGSSGNSFHSPYVFCLFCATDFVWFCFHYLALYLSIIIESIWLLNIFKIVEFYCMSFTLEEINSI